MNLSEPFIRRPIATTLIMAAILVFGIFAYNSLPVSNLPDVNYPTITVTVTFPGTNPQTMANTVATPLEKQFMTIPGVKAVTSNNTLGSTQVIIQFEINRDIDLAAVDVEAAIVAAKPQLPRNLPQDPTFKKVNPSSTPVVYLVATSATLTQGQLYDYANTFIGQRISIIDGVSQVGVYGSPYAIRVQIDPGQVASLGISQAQLATALDAANQYNPLGQFDGNTSAYTIYDNAGLRNAAAVEPIIVAYNNNAPVRVGDFATVVDSLQNDRQKRRFINKELDQLSVTLAVLLEPGANAVKVADAINQLLPTLIKQLPGSLDLIMLFDRSVSIKESVKDVELTLLIAFVLVVMVIFIYLGNVRDTIIPSLVMPMSVVATFAVIYPLGYTLDNLSLLALTLAIGFIIDDAIVVLENIVRTIEEGSEPFEAALLGSQQISFTIVSMTVSLLAVFIPLIFMAGLIGKLFREFSITLAIVTVASGIISLTLTPMLCSRFIPPREKGEAGSMAQISKRINSWMLNHYKRGLTRVLRRRKTMLGIGFLSVLLSILFFKILPTDFIPNEDIGFIQAFTEAAQGTSSDQMAKLQRQVFEALKDEPTIDSFISITANPEYRQGVLFLALIPRNQRKSIDQLIPDFAKKVRGIPGINVFFKPLPLIDLNVGPQVRGNYQFLIQSLDNEKLYTSAEALMEKMLSDPAFVGISTDLEVKTPQINIDIQRDLASTLGIDALTLETAFEYGFSGNRVSRIQTPIDQYDLILELNRDDQRTPASLDYMYVRSNTTNAMIPLSAIVNTSEGVGPASVNHFAQFPSVTITFNLADGIALSDGLDKLRKYAKETFADGVNGDVTGAAETFEESVKSMGILLILTVFVIYIVLGILYESFIHPVTILSTLPPAIVGGLFTLWITGRPLSLYAYLGIVLLVGIVKKNGIMMVDFALDNIRSKGETAEKSIYDACILRFRPIMMTTIAAIMGAVPIALGIGAGADSRRPLGYVIIGGMVVSQMITLFLTPVIYLTFEEWREKFDQRFSLKK